jgi:hypothetical protein
MFNPTQIVIEAFIRELRTMYERTYGILEPDNPGIIGFAAQLALENIAKSDAAYHDVNHTMLVTLSGRKFCVGSTLASGELLRAIGVISSSRCYVMTSGTFVGSVEAMGMAITSPTWPVIR